MRRLCCLLISVLSATSVSAHAGDKLTCSTRELARQDCRLTAGSIQLRLLRQTVAWSDGVWHAVNPFPLNGEAVAWEKIEMAQLGQWPILQLWLWDKGVGESQVQSLHWFTYSAAQQRLALLAEGVVRKRHPETPAQAEPPVKKAKYLFDAWENHSLKLVKPGVLEWQLSGQKKTLVKKQVVHGV